MTDLLALAGRVEAEGPSYPFWNEAFHAVYPRPDPGSDEYYEKWHPRWSEFNRYLNAWAWRDAAAMLMPPNCNTSVEMNWSGNPMACANAFPIDRATGKQICPSTDGEAFEPHAEARAALACALRLHAKLKGLQNGK